MIDKSVHENVRRAVDATVNPEPWEQFKKLRSRLCETCNHAFEHHGTRMTGASICWVAECNCREAK